MLIGICSKPALYLRLFVFSLIVIASYGINLFSNIPAYGQGGGTVTVVSAANYRAPLAPDSIAAAFGANLATRVESASTSPLPTSIAGISVRVNGALAPLFFISPGQINFIIPSGTATGTAQIEVRANDVIIATGTVTIASAAPAIFTANSNGEGALAAQLLRVRSNGELIYEQLAQFSAAEGRFLTRPIDFGPESDQLFLVLYLTGIRQAPSSGVRINLGGSDYAVSYSGPAPGFAGLDQINVPLARTFGGRGRINLFARATGIGASNSGEIEIGAGTSSQTQMQLTGISTNLALVGEEMELIGAGFAADPREHNVQILSADGLPAKADVLAVVGDRLLYRTPLGAGTGSVKVSRGQVEATFPINVRTSISGFVEEARTQPDGSVARVAIPGMRVRIVGQPASEKVSSADGSFVLPDPPTGAVTIEIVGPASGPLNYPSQRVKLAVRPDRDNQMPRSTEMAAISGPQFPLVDGAVPDAQINFLLAGRTPVNLPVGHFSSRIAQITPFGVALPAPTKLTFPNADAIPAGTKATLFKFDQNQASETLGQFIAIGEATVSADGQTIETAANAITEGSYYFASISRPLGAINGRVVEKNGRPVPRAIVQVRGQSTFTDGFGGFVLRDVAVIRTGGDRVRVEVSYQRPDGSISRNDRTEVDLVAGNLVTITPEIALDAVTRNVPPIVLAPLSLTLTAGVPRDFEVAINDPDADQSAQITLGGNAADFSSISLEGLQLYRLRVAPSDSTIGNYTLLLRATDVGGQTVTQSIAVTVKQPEFSKPTAQSQAVTTAEDISKVITLTGSIPTGESLTYRITRAPSRGTLSGEGNSFVYTPTANYNGTDSFTFKAVASGVESDPATVFISILPRNDTPALNVPGAQALNAGETINLLITANDVDGEQTLTLTANNLPAGATFPESSGTSRQMSWTPTFAQAGSYTISFTVTDNAVPSVSITKSVTLTVGVLWGRTAGPEGGGAISLINTGKAIFMGNNGGIVRSTDDGRNWVDVNEGLRASNAYALTYLGDTIFAGIFGAGVYRSTNNGDTWVRTSNGINDEAMFCMVTSGTTILAGTTNGRVFRSTNNGDNWTDVSAGLPSGLLNVFRVAGNTVFVATTNQGVYRMPLNGTSWTPARQGLPQNTNGTYVQTFSLAVGDGVIYVGLSNGGVYRSSNNGDSWTQVGASLPSGVSALELAGSKLYAGGSGLHRLESNDIWVRIGAGANDGFSRMDFSGPTFFVGGGFNGVYRSTDRGETFRLSSSGINLHSIPSILATDQFLLAGCEGGVFRSTSNGDSWTFSSNGLPATPVSDLAIIGNTIFATDVGRVWRSTDGGLNWQQASNGITRGTVGYLYVSGTTLYAAGTSAFYRSTDLGNNWTDLSNGLTEYGIGSILVNGTTLFAGVTSPINNAPFSDKVTLYRSTDNGATWTPVNNGVQPGAGGSFGPVFDLGIVGNTIYASFNGRIYRSTNNGDSWTLTAGEGLDSSVRSLIISETVFYAGTFGGGVFRSDDRGEHWTRFQAGLKSQLIFTLALHGNTLFTGSYGGVFRATPSGQSWSPNNTGLNSLYTNAILSNNDNIFVGTLGSGISRSPDRGSTWVPINTGLPANSNVQSVIASGNTLYAGLFGDGVYTSNNQGAGWTAVNNGLTNKFVNRLFTSGNAVYAGTDGGVFRSTDGGANWTAINTGLTNLRVVSFTANAGVTYAGTDGGGAFRLNSNGTSWSQINQGLDNLSVTALGVNNNVIYAGTNGGGVYISRDGGDHWTAVNNNLPSTLGIFSIANSGQKIYASSVYGVYVTENEGGLWKQISAGLVDPYVTGLAVSGDRLFASTLRGGVFSSRIPQ